MPFLYETHMHTCQASACGVSTGKDHVHFYRDAGYAGIIMTDHFFRGNTAVDRRLPWKDRIDWFWSGYEDAKAEGDKAGLDVFFGLEQNFAGDEYLIYGLTKEYMKEHPEMEHWTRRQQLEEVHRAGGCVIQAHPFRIRGYMDRIRIGTAFCDGIEAANAGNDPLDDARACRMGRTMGLVMTAGSDNHRSPIPEPYGVVLEKKLTCIGDYVRVILNREPVGLLVPEDRFTATGDAVPDERHIAYLLDAEEKDTVYGNQWMLND